MFEKILLAGADWMTVSIDGLYDAYEKNRYPLRFDETYQRLQGMKRINDKIRSLPKLQQQASPCREMSILWNGSGHVKSDISF